ncbi:hypothetical protein TNCV_1293681 [Trichonephila clavipes]|nr:hypothetical protein TNCV_1293681 [Trichonephila clavipes]
MEKGAISSRRLDFYLLVHGRQQEKPVKHSMAEAVREAVDEKMMEKGTLAVAVDGSWQKRGFSSRRMAC